MKALWLFVVCGVQLACVAGIEYVHLDISNVDTKAFTQVEETEYRKVITANQGYAIKDIVDGYKDVSRIQDGVLATRKVYLERFTKQQYEGKEIVPLYDENDEFQVVEIETIVLDVTIRNRLVLNDQGQYVELKEVYDDFDICEEDVKDFTKVLQRKENGILASYYAAKGKRMGAVKCGRFILMRRDNGIYSRYAESINQKWYIYTTPYIGNTFKTEFIPAAWEDCSYRRVDEGSYFVDLSVDPIENYRGVLSRCGENCLFFDGCSNSDFRIVDVLDKHGVIYMGHKAKCIDIKLQTNTNERYLSVYARLVDGTHETVMFKSHEEAPFKKHKLQPVNLELTASSHDEHITVMEEKNVKTYYIETPLNLTWTIGAVTYNGKPLVGKGFLEDPDKVPYVVLGRKIIVDGEFTTIITETDHDYPTNITYVTDDSGVWLYRRKPIQLNLANLSTNNPNFRVTQIGEANYHITTQLERTKIGTIRLGQSIIRPNQYHALASELVFGRSALLVTTQLAGNLKFYSKFMLTKGFFGESNSVFVERQKDPLDLGLEDVFTGKIPASFCTEIYGSYLRVYLCKNMFVHTMGSVKFGNNVIAPYSRYFEWREVYVSMDFFLSSVIVKSYTAEGECVVDSFSHRVVNSDVRFIRASKIPLSIDINSDFVPPQQISRVQDDKVYLYRIKPEFALYYRIGKIKYKGEILVKDDVDVLSRAVNILEESKESEPTKYTIRVADVLNNGTRAKLYSMSSSNRTLVEAKKSPLIIDVSLDATRHTSVMLKQHNDILSLHVPWTRSCDYSVNGVIFTGNIGEPVQILDKDAIKGVPEVRLYKPTTPGGDIKLSVSSQEMETAHLNVKIEDSTVVKVETTDANEIDEAFMAYFGHV